MSRVVLLYDRFHPQIGGMERMIDELARSLAGSHRVRVLAQATRSLREPREHGAVSVARCRWWDASSTPCLRDADVVIGFGYTPYSLRAHFPLAVARRALSLGARLAWCPTHYPVADAATGRAPHGWKGALPPAVRGAARSWMAARYHELFAACDAIFALTEVEADHWRRLFPERAVHLCPHGVSDQHAACTDRAAAGRRLRERYGDGPLIVSIGRVGAHKNQAVLVAAMPHVLQRHPDARLVLVGPAVEGEADAVRDLAARLSVSEAVAFAGAVPDAELCDLYTGAACVAHPSRHEASGLTPLEAVAHGTPAIHSGRGALARYHSLPGCTTVDSLDAPAAWAEAIVHCLDDGEGRRERAREGRDIVLGGHTWQAMAARIAAEIDLTARGAPLTAAGREPASRA